MSGRKKHLIPIIALLLIGQQALAQNPTPNTNHRALADFIADFEVVELPFQLHPPSLDIEVHPLLAQPGQVQRFLDPHGLGHNAEVRAGHVLYQNTSFVALTVLVSLGEERAWYLITFSQDGKAIDRGRIGAYYGFDGWRHEHWSEVTESLQVAHTSLYRSYGADGGEEACTRSHWRWQLASDGSIERSEGELSEDCSR